MTFPLPLLALARPTAGVSGRLRYIYIHRRASKNLSGFKTFFLTCAHFRQLQTAREKNIATILHATFMQRWAVIVQEHRISVC
jgi:hypothetical protein